MRFFTIKDLKENIAVVFHDHNIGYVLCRSKKDSFRMVFDSMAKRVSSRFIPKDNVLILESFDVSNMDWIDIVLKEACSNDIWSIGDTGEIIGSEENIDLKISEILS